VAVGQDHDLRGIRLSRDPVLLDPLQVGDELEEAEPIVELAVLVVVVVEERGRVIESLDEPAVVDELQHDRFRRVPRVPEVGLVAVRGAEEVELEGPSRHTDEKHVGADGSAKVAARREGGVRLRAIGISPAACHQAEQESGADPSHH
jgi:hypothetical protein